MDYKLLYIKDLSKRETPELAVNSGVLFFSREFLTSFSAPEIVVFRNLRSPHLTREIAGPAQVNELLKRICGYGNPNLLCWDCVSKIYAAGEVLRVFESRSEAPR